MQSITNIAGILLIIFGILTLGYEGFTYTKHEKVAQIGDLKISADTQKTVYFPPIVGGAAFVAGIALVVIARRGGK
jgi:TRAP-type C4-dicarboxylate transport system permease small subunit